MCFGLIVLVIYEGYSARAPRKRDLRRKIGITISESSLCQLCFTNQHSVKPWSYMDVAAAGSILRVGLFISAVITACAVSTYKLNVLALEVLIGERSYVKWILFMALSLISSAVLSKPFYFTGHRSLV